MLKREKGNCYQSAAEFLIDKYSAGNERGDLKRYVVVHGLPTLTRPPFKKYGHAWIETDKMVYDTETKIWLPKSFYYLVGKIDPDENYYYDFIQLRKFILHYKHYGPWEGPEGVGPLIDGKKTKKAKKGKQR